jgi:outer membrane murein-binding lipoprotein Lpp
MPRAGIKFAVIAAVCATLLLGGCVYQQHGARFDPDAINQLRSGISTERDAIALLGKPRSVSAAANGGELLQWMFFYGTAIGVGGGAHAAILFDRDRKMVRVTHLWQS